MAKSNSQINKESDNIVDSPNSPAVIAYRLGQVEVAVSQGFAAHNEKLDAIVNSFATKAESKAIELRVSDLESDRKWLIRTIIGAVMVAVLSLIGIGSKFVK